jgi:hypothetical protein
VQLPCHKVRFVRGEIDRGVGHLFGCPETLQGRLLYDGPRVLQIFGFLSVVAMAITFYFAVTTPAVGPSTPDADILLVTIFGSGVLIYIARYFFYKGNGINIGKMLQEIPPE